MTYRMTSEKTRVPLWIFDFSVFILILFPFLTGGVWYRRPGLWLELSELGVPVLLVGALALFLRKFLKIPLDESWSLRSFRRIWALWSGRLEARPAFTLWGAAILVGTGWAMASLLRHWSFGSHSFDLGIFTNAIWNLVHGHGYISSLKDGMNLFADHQSPLFWLLAPVFKLFPFPETLLVAQGLGLALGGVAVCFLGRQYLRRGHWFLTALPLIYWLYLPIRNANAFDFHPEVFLLPLFLAGILGMQGSSARSRILGGVAFVLALGAKESAPPILTGIGIAWLLGASPQSARAFTRRVAPVLIVAGILVFYIDLRVVPQLFEKEYAYQDAYKHFGISPGDIFLSPIAKPELFWSQILGAARLKFLFWTLAPLAFLPLFNGRVFLVSIPAYLMLFLSQGDLRVGLHFHYGIEPSVGLFWALPGALLALEKKRVGRWLMVWVAFWVLAASGRSEMYRIRNHLGTSHSRWLAREVIPRVDPAVSLAASDSLVPHLATRPWIRNLSNIRAQDGKIVACILVDTGVDNGPLSPDELSGLEGFLRGLGYRQRWACRSVRVFERDVPCLSSLPECD
jgi:uncharacterized membrane protein